MSHINSVRDYLKKVENARRAGFLGVRCEGPENCGHNNDTEFFQGCILQKLTSGNKAYEFIGYQNKASLEDFDNILTASNTNKNRNNNTASDQGLGIDTFFWQKCKNVILLTYYEDEKRFNVTEWATVAQIKHLKQLQANGKQDSINRLADKYTKRYENAVEEDIPTTIIQLFKNIKQTCTRKKITYPKFMIFGLSRDKYQPLPETPFNECEIYKEHEECEDFYAKKYHDLPIDYYFIKGEINGEDELLLTKINKIDILGTNFKQDTIKCEVKIFQKQKNTGIELTLVKFESEKGIPHFFALRPNGRKNAYLQNLCNTDGKILETNGGVCEKWKTKIKEAEDEGYSFEVEYYGLRNDKLPYKEMNDRYFNETYAGVYVLEKLRRHEGYFLLNPKPKSVSEVFRNTKAHGFKNLRHVGGKLFRCVIRVKNKIDTLNTEARRIESKLHDDTKYAVGSIHNTLWKIYYSKKWMHQGRNILPSRNVAKFVKKDVLLNLLYSDTKNRQPSTKFFNNKNISNKNQKKPPCKTRGANTGSKNEDEVGSWYARLYETKTNNNEETSWVIKVGKCYERRLRHRCKENNRNLDKEGLRYLSGIEIGQLPVQKDTRLEEIVKELFKAHDDFTPIIKNGHKTDRCNIYEFETWLMFKRVMGVIERDIHEFGIQSDDELKKTLYETYSKFKN